MIYPRYLSFSLFVASHLLSWSLFGSHQHCFSLFSLCQDQSPFEPAHDKTNKMACAPSEDSDQPGHPPSLISLHCALNGLLRIQAFFIRTAKSLIRLGGCPGWSESSLGEHTILLVLSCAGSFCMGMCAQRRLRSAGIRLVWSESSLCTQWVVKDPSFLHTDNWSESSLGDHAILLVLSCAGSFCMGMCAQRRLRSAWASAQSDQSLRCTLNGLLRILAFFIWTADLSLHWANIPFCWFCHALPHFVYFGGYIKMIN